MERSFDIIVIGGGHSGSEAAHAAAKLGHRTLLITNNIDQIASMPCNPAIGGPAKSQLVKEIDALGGIMGLAADATYLQMKTLNSSKGPAVRALRAQSDKREYAAWVRQYLEATENLTIYQASAQSLIIENNKAIGVVTKLEEKILAKAVVLTAGTFLEGRIFSGDKFESAGRAGEQPSLELSPKLQNLGLKTGRLKTGTPPRIDKTTIDFSGLELAPGDKELEWFSFLPHRPVRQQYPCHITRTNEKTHEIIMDNLDKSPMYSGLVAASGPRYCPSIEDKVVRFDKNPSHHFFLEMESLSSNEIYLQGCSTSLPIEVQWQIVHSLPGLENAVITRPAYAVEYDYFPAIQFKHNLESKIIAGLFVAGQVLGTSGYEEAAAQGLIAGINAAHFVNDKEPFVLDRSSSYIGTLVDDLVTKEINDPYRMLTSRSEYRLILRQDNADTRLTPLGRELGLVDDYRWHCFQAKQKRIDSELQYLKSVRVPVSKVNKDLEKQELEQITYKSGAKILLADLLRRPDFNYKHLNLEDLVDKEDKEHKRLAEKGIQIDGFAYGYELDTMLKYDGYIERQSLQIEDMKKFEKIKIPEGFDFKGCELISLEARDKLDKVRPQSLGQASRVGGVSPNDLSVLSMIVKTRS
ncbi:MAG: tRNA uridine-5-carboxymethylaminomethyl(34) synthesis enzyme MnmG [Cyanobacteria bacterium]|nr:tRNA uridine-5-carboxymethylaminomethyl(34) synthesis enzyme MnmG [Cyanobacteriota bacterium]